jgi:MFS family permease
MIIKPLAGALLAAHVLSLLAFSTYAAILPVLRDEWHLSNTEAGWIASGFFVGYVATVSTWSAMTDRVDARYVYLAGSLLAALGSFLFAGFARGFAGAMTAQILLGAGNAATYMPGLRILSDRTTGTNQSRYVSFYTSFFGVGVACSLWLAGYAVPVLGWPMTFAVSGMGPVLSALLVLAATRPLAPPAGDRHQPRWAHLFPLAAWKRVLSERECLTYTLGYGFHCAELFGMRAWIVAFLAYAASVRTQTPFLSPTSVVAIASVFSAPASIVGNECALRLGRRRWIHLVMGTTSLLGVAMALFAQAPWGLMVGLVWLYCMGIMADSATLTAGMVTAAPAGIKGAAMGLYSLVGFGLGGALGPAIFGLALDLTQSWGSMAGQSTRSEWMPSQPMSWTSVSWAMAFLALGLPCLLFPWLDNRLHARRSR